jgi:hypothetical protein
MRRATGLVRAMSTTKTASAKTSYATWKGPSQCPTPVVAKLAIPLPLRPPPALKCPNTLPPRPPTPSPQGFKSSRHIIPAAFPRTYKQSIGTLERGSHPFTKSPRETGESKEERGKRNLGEAKECIMAKFNATPTKEDDQAASGLWIAGERWIREGGRKEGGLTLVLSAANGFTKEVRPSPTHYAQSHKIELDASGPSSGHIDRCQ